MAFQQLGGVNGVGFYVGETFVAAGFSSAKIGTVAYAIIQFCHRTFFYCDPTKENVPITMIGQKTTSTVSTTGTFIGCFLTGTSFFLKGHNLSLEWFPILAVAGVLIYKLHSQLGWELFLRALPGAWWSLVNWFGAWTVSYTLNLLWTGVPRVHFSFFSGMCALPVLFVAKMVPPTKVKTLEEIQISINS